MKLFCCCCPFFGGGGGGGGGLQLSTLQKAYLLKHIILLLFQARVQQLLQVNANQSHEIQNLQAMVRNCYIINNSGLISHL